MFGVFLAECDFFVWVDFYSEYVFFNESVAVFWFVVVPKFTVVDVFYDFGGVFDSGFFLYFSF